MSKSVGNVVNPDDVIAKYGADAMRLFEMFMGPLEATKPWSTSGVDGVRRFLDRAWRLYVNEETDACLVTDDAPSTEALRALHKCIRKVTDDLEGMRFNTAISALMEFVNFLTPRAERPRIVMEAFARLLAPLAPHAGEELWARMGHGETLAYEPWPTWDAALVQDETQTYAVQVNGKLRGQVELPVDVTQEAAIAAAREQPNVAKFLAEGEIKKTVFVKGRMVNFVVAGA
jgi:leucyl-tRNA synthetase